MFHHQNMCHMFHHLLAWSSPSIIALLSVTIVIAVGVAVDALVRAVSLTVDGVHMDFDIIREICAAKLLWSSFASIFHIALDFSLEFSIEFFVSFAYCSFHFNSVAIIFIRMVNFLVVFSLFARRRKWNPIVTILNAGKRVSYRNWHGLCSYSMHKILFQYRIQFCECYEASINRFL